jgi:hypothetical protein
LFFGGLVVNPFVRDYPLGRPAGFGENIRETFWDAKNVKTLSARPGRPTGQLFKYSWFCAVANRTRSSAIIINSILFFCGFARFNFMLKSQ